MLAGPFAAIISGRLRRSAIDAARIQESLLLRLLTEGRKTAFGSDHGFSNVNSYKQFREAVPIREYEQFKPYNERIKL